MSGEHLLERVLARLEGVEGRDGCYKALCPAHDDHNPSLSVREVAENGQEKVLLKCWAGCDTEAVLEKLGLGWKDLFSGGETGSPSRIVATYDYTDAAGNLLHQTVRFEPKRFSQRRPDGNGGWAWNLRGLEPVLYGLPNVCRAVSDGERVFVVEGEKDAERARDELGIVATTCPMGAEKWRDSYTDVLREAYVVLIPDNDRAGRAHVVDVAGRLLGVAASVKVLDLPGMPEKGDLSDWLDAGGTKEALNTLVENAPEFDSGLIGGGFGPNESLPVKTVSEVLAESGDGPEWIVESLLAKGNITDLSGEAKFSGKTTWAMHMIARVLEGEDFMGFPTVRSKVLYLTEQGNNFAEAVQKAGLEDADGGLFVVLHRDVRAITWKDLVSKAVEDCERLGAGVLLVDTFAAFSGIVGTEENNSGNIHEKMAPLKEAAQVHDLAVLYIRHAGKSGRARGSSQFEAEGDIILTLKRAEGNQKENVRVLEGIGRYDDIPRKLNIELAESGYVALGSDKRVEFRKAVEAVKRVVPRARDNAITQEALLEALEGEGTSKKTMQRALTWLVDQKAIRREGKGVKKDPYLYWMPPGDPAASPKREVENRSGRTPGLKDRKRNPKKDGGDGWVIPFPQRRREQGIERGGPGALITDSGRLHAEAVPALERCGSVALDIETTGLSPFEGRVRLLSLHADGETYLVDCFAVDPSPALEAIKNKVLYVHGAEFDLPFLRHAYGFAPTETPIDTLHLSQVVRAGEWDRGDDGGWERKKHSLKDALERELGVRLGNKKKYQQGKAWTGELTEEHLGYATGDVAHLEPLAERLFYLLEECDLEAVWDLEQRTKPLFLEMCAQGIPFDKARWDELARELEAKVFELEERADALAPPRPEGGAWNWFSPQQAKEAFVLAGLDVPDLRRQTLSAYEQPLVKAVSEYRDARNELSRHRKWYEGRYKDGRVYPHWRPCGAATGRASCTDPNVQSLTKAGGYRGCVRPENGRVLVKADVNQMELRVLAAITEDENMLEVFRGGGDLNVNTAQALTGRKVEKDDPERQRAKAVNSGLSYGMGAKRFLEKAKDDYDITMTLEEAKEAKRKLLAAYPGIGHWHRREAEECRRGNFETRTLFGRRRVVEPDHEGKPKFTERLNAPVQGTAADVLKLALARLGEGREEHPNALPIITVHDEVVVECNAEEAPAVVEWLDSTLRGALADVLGYEELAGEDAVKTTVIRAWGDE